MTAAALFKRNERSLSLWLGLTGGLAALYVTFLAQTFERFGHGSSTSFFVTLSIASWVPALLLLLGFPWLGGILELVLAIVLALLGILFFAPQFLLAPMVTVAIGTLAVVFGSMRRSDA